MRVIVEQREPDGATVRVETGPEMTVEVEVDGQGFNDAVVKVRMNGIQVFGLEPGRGAWIAAVDPNS